MRGNVIQLAVAVVIGAAFNAVVTTFTDAFVKPLIQLIAGGNAFSGAWVASRNAKGEPEVVFDWSLVVNAAITFLITAAVVYFVFVMPMNKLTELRVRGKEREPEKLSDEVRLLTEIRDALVARNTNLPR